jgi:hypothetical protein
MAEGPPVPDNVPREFSMNDGPCPAESRLREPEELNSNDPEKLRAALTREWNERRRAECRAGMQTEVVTLALDLLLREPNIDGCFGALARTMV